MKRGGSVDFNGDNDATGGGCKLEVSAIHLDLDVRADHKRAGVKLPARGATNLRQIIATTSLKFYLVCCRSSAYSRLAEEKESTDSTIEFEPQIKQVARASHNKSQPSTNTKVISLSHLIYEHPQTSADYAQASAKAN